MRKGLSLVEMMIAIILFGVLSVIGFKYSQNYYNTSLMTKKALVATLTEQATQLSSIYNVYEAQFGQAPASMDDLNASNVMLLTEQPAAISEIDSTGTGWSLVQNLAADDATTNDYGFTYPVNTGDAPTNLTLCNIINNEVNSSWGYDTAAAPTTLLLGIPAVGSNKIVCYGAGPYTVAFIKQIN